jgi:hypothetical protein
MASDYIFPTNSELRLIAQDKLPRLIADRAGFTLMPIETKEEALLMWEQKDNFSGLQQVRGLDAVARRVKPAGLSRYTMQPGYYADFIPIMESDLTLRRVPGTYATPIDLTDIVMDHQDHLLQRRLDRMELIIWNLLLTGTFSVLDGTLVLQTDTYSVQTFSASVPWGTWATATPLADLRTIQLKHRGHSVSFGGGATLYVNQKTANDMLINTNPADIYGRRAAGLGTYNSMSLVNQLLTGDDLPDIVIYDETYFDDNGATQLFIPDNKGVLVGRRPAGQVVGNYRVTRNASNPGGAAGPYMAVIDHGEDFFPRLIEVYDAHNGGPVIYYPSAVVACSFGT